MRRWLVGLGCVWWLMAGSAGAQPATMLPNSPLTLVSITGPMADNPYLAATVADPRFAGRAEMNGIRFADYQGFEKKWQLVTVRFRKDTGEMRFTYANPLAWATMKAGRTDYPDGAVFGKFSVMTDHDPDFINSVVPSGKTRYQLMVRDAARYVRTEGWGYALFDSTGRTMPGDPVLIANACNACHLLIPDKGYVFSEPMALTGVAFGISRTRPSGSGRVPFTIATTRSLPEQVRRHIPEPYKEVKLVTGPISQHMFDGTLDEIRPTLLAEAKRTNHPAVLHDARGGMFSMVFPDPDKATCPAATGQTGRKFHALRSVAMQRGKLMRLTLCE